MMFNVLGENMADYLINGKTIVLDNSKKYLDFFLKDKEQHLVELNLDGLLGAIQSGELPLNDDLASYMNYLKRWTVEAPRKRGYRQLRKEGITVATPEQFFDGEDGAEIINNLENTGKFAEYFLKEVYGK